MYKFRLLILVTLTSFSLYAQTPTAQELHATAKAFMKEGDYPNAIMVLNRAIEMEPQNIPVSKDLALSYYYQKDNTKAITAIKPALDRDEADDQTFQIAGNIYRQMDDSKEAEKVLKKGLKKFPDSGPLYNDLGELEWSTQDYDAIKQWEKGIEVDPSYSRNYYNAARFYFLSPDKVWSLVYGEIFLNMEPNSNRAPEIKKLLVDSYKKLFTDANLVAANKDKNDFVQAFIATMNRQTSVAAMGINTETLSMIRTRFIIDWFYGAGKKMPYKLFDYQSQLLKEGLFDAYNQWLFGTVQNLSAYQNWVNTHADEQKAFSEFQKVRIFRMPAGQYYRGK